jgi:hypothetical protein
MCSEQLTKAILGMQMAREDIAEAHKTAKPLEALFLLDVLNDATQLYGKLLRLEEAINAAS